MDVLDFDILSDITNIEVIAKGLGVHIRRFLNREFGRGNWRKLNGQYKSTAPYVNTKQLVQAIHDAPHRIVFAAAGAGTSALADLLSVAGASNTLLEAIVPYSQAAFDDFLGQTPKQYVASPTARLMAGRALTRAYHLRHADEPVIGIACTAAISSYRAKRGEHRAHIAVWQATQLIEYSLHLDKGRRDRAGEEELVSRLLLNALAATCSVDEQLDVPLSKGDELTTEAYDFATYAEQLAQHTIDFFALNDHGRIRIADVRPQVLLSGSFNPLHDGHLGMARAASQILDQPVAFELSAFNVEKPPLPTAVILERISQFAGRYPIYVSNAPTFSEKARLYPGATFIIGYDTAVRLFVPRFYGNSAAQMMAALHELQELGCDFLVAGRVNKAGDFQTVADIDVPPDFADLLRPISAELFRNDTSSSALRAAGERGIR